MNRYNVMTVYTKIVDSLNNFHRTMVKQDRLGYIDEHEFLLIFRNHSFMERLRSLFSPPTEVFRWGNGVLYLGNCINAADQDFLIDKKISLIVNASREVPNHFEDDPETKIQYLRVSAHDVAVDSNKIIVPEIVDVVVRCLERGENVFTHCFMGRSRSVSVCIQVIRSLVPHRSVQDVYLGLKKKRPIVHINTRFYETLVDHHDAMEQKNK